MNNIIDVDFKKAGKNKCEYGCENGSILLEDATTDNYTALSRIRHWLIKKIAGDDTIILNASLSIVEFNGYPVEVDNISGGIVSDNYFNAPEGKAFKIQSWSEI